MATLPADSQPPVRRSRPLVLLIEDNLTELELYTMVADEEFSVVTATRGDTGFALALHERPDVIVVDVLLPDVDGLILCEWLRTNAATSSIPVIVMTGDDTAYARATVMRSELTGVLMKPFPADRLLTALANAIDRSR
jgi:DNA-binding response OmpR family regulator